jgi:GNAT superfamily N-acetyltransferase
MDAPVRRVDVAELPDCVRLAVSREWNPEERKWALLFDIGVVYGIDDPDGGLAGTVVATRYGDDVTAISMMLVAEKFERQGLGTRLMRHALAEAKTASVWLTATDEGRPLYEKVGFRAIGQSSQHLGRLTAPASGATRPASTKDMAGIAAMDAEVFGAPRTELLDRLPSFARHLRVVDGPDGIVGYGAVLPNAEHPIVGPVIAEDFRTARALIADLAAAVDGPIRLDIENRQVLDWAVEHGLHAEWTTSVMVHGDALPGDRGRLFLPVMVALG